MIVVTSEQLPGYVIAEALGLAKGSTIRCTHLGTDFMAALHNLVGGEITEYTSMIAQAREQALDRLVESARQLGANAVVALRFSTTEVMGGAAEILAYGTAVRVEKNIEKRNNKTNR